MKVHSDSNVSQPWLARAAEGVGRSARRLASGKRVDSAADDPSARAVLDLLAAETSALRQASRNAADGVSMAQVAEGGMSSISTSLSRMRELATRSASGTLSPMQRQIVAEEFASVSAGIDDVIETTEFNGRKLLDPSASDGFSIQVGDHAGQTVEIAACDLSGAQGILLDDPDAALERIDEAIETVSAGRARNGASIDRLGTAMSELDSRLEALTASASRVGDVDVAGEVVELTKHQILSQAGVSALAQANRADASALSLLD